MEFVKASKVYASMSQLKSEIDLILLEREKLMFELKTAQDQINAYEEDRSRESDRCTTTYECACRTRKLQESADVAIRMARIIHAARIELAALFPKPSEPTLSDAILVCGKRNEADANCILKAFLALQEYGRARG